VVSETDWQRFDRCYQELLRRDGRAEDRERRWARTALASLAAVVVLSLVCAWLVSRAREVRTVVQVVRQDASGTVVQVGIPHDLLAYTPTQGQWMEMLGQWVLKRYWRSGDVVVQQANWGWLYRHTCGEARQVLQHLEAREQPFSLTDTRVTVELGSVTKTDIPQSFQVLFTTRTTDRAHPQAVERRWTATFAVGRTRPPTLTDALENRLGLCVTGFDEAELPKERS
jgi:type IV secretory pathway TrbF-like protein